MAVIIRENRTIGGKNFSGVKVFKSERFVTRDAEKKAEELDILLANKMRDLEWEVRTKGWLELKGKAGVVKLWHEVGKALSFIEKVSVEPEDDRKYIWRALYDHAGDLAPGTPNKRAEDRYLTSHFYYCFRLGRFSWDFVEKAGNWTAWVEFFDSERIRADERIINWLGSKARDEQPKGLQDWLRALTREVRRKFKNWDTREMITDDLNNELEECYAQVFANGGRT